MADGLERFGGPALVILSGKDLTAREFEDAAKASPLWSRLLKESRVTVERLPEADHTFSRAVWRTRVEETTCDWLNKAMNCSSLAKPSLALGGSGGIVWLARFSASHVRS